MAQMSLAGHWKKNILVLLPETDTGFIPAQFGSWVLEEASHTRMSKIVLLN